MLVLGFEMMVSLFLLHEILFFSFSVVRDDHEDRDDRCVDLCVLRLLRPCYGGYSFLNLDS